MIMTPLEIDDQNELREIEPPLRFPAPVKWLAKILSWVFHPLFIPVYVSWFLVKVQPYLFASFDPFEQIIVMIRFFCDVCHVPTGFCFTGQRFGVY